MNYILIANIKDKTIENKYLEQFKDYLKAYENDKAYILKAKNINIKFESILCKLTLEIVSKYLDRGIIIIDMTDTYKKISETVKNENNIKITDKRVVMPIRKAMIDYLTLKYKFNNVACPKSRITNGSFSTKSGIVTKKCQESVKFLGKL